MMHDCPKCGFHQPKDRFCANCGIDIERYEQKPKPILSRLIQNTNIQIGLIIFIIFSLVGFIYYSQRQVIENTIAKAIGSSSEPEQVSEEKEKSSDESVDASAAKSLATYNQLKNSQPEKSLKVERTGEAKSIRQMPTRLQFEFAEVPRAFVQEIITEGQVLNETQNTRSVFFAYDGSIKNLKKNEVTPFFLPGGTSSNISPENPTRIEFLRFVKGYTAEVGLIMDVDVTSATNESVELEIQAIISLPAHDGTVTSTEFQGTYKIGTNGVLAIAGLVPQQAIHGEAETALANTPLSIMTSADFVARSTEFIVFIRAE